MCQGPAESTSPPSLGQDEAAPFQKSAEKKLCRSKLDPAGAWLRLAGGRPVVGRQGGWQFPAVTEEAEWTSFGA